MTSRFFGGRVRGFVTLSLVHGSLRRWKVLKIAKNVIYGQPLCMMLLLSLSRSPLGPKNDRCTQYVASLNLQKYLEVSSNVYKFIPN